MAIFADARLRQSRAVAYEFEMFSGVHNSKTVPPRQKLSGTNIDVLRPKYRLEVELWRCVYEVVRKCRFK